MTASSLALALAVLAAVGFTLAFRRSPKPRLVVERVMPGGADPAALRRLPAAFRGPLERLIAAHLHLSDAAPAGSSLPGLAAELVSVAIPLALEGGRIETALARAGEDRTLERDRRRLRRRRAALLEGLEAAADEAAKGAPDEGRLEASLHRLRLL